MPARRAHYVVSTHWDREWYQPFQDYRYRLVRLLDNALAGLDSGEMRGPFTTDGQAIILEDYLEVRPECEALLRQCAADGRLRIGPWYVLPDEFLVSGEALVRNLRLGRELARAWGGAPSNAGFVCDIFGHNSQLPQILAGFGMETAFVWRGVNESGQRLFRWIGADDTEVLAYRFESVGYSSYASLVRASFAHATPRADELEELEDKLDAYVAAMGAQTETDSILLFDGGDHQEWDRDAYRVLAARLGQHDGPFEYVHTALDEFAAEVLAQRERVTTSHRGELREPARWSRHARRPMADPRRAIQPHLDQAAQRGLPGAALPLGRAALYPGDPSPRRALPARVPRRRLALAAQEPAPRLDLRL